MTRSSGIKSRRSGCDCAPINAAVQQSDERPRRAPVTTELDEALIIKRDADPTFDFCGYLQALPQTNGMFMGNANIMPRQPRNYLYHAYLVYMESQGYKNVLTLKMFGLGLPLMLKEHGLNYDKQRTN